MFTKKKMKSIILIVPYFGRWPEWIELYWASCGENPTIQWVFFTDCAIPENPPANLRFVALSFEQYCAEVSARLGIPFHPSDPYKLCDLKPALGYLHEDEIEGYDFWGFTDIDIVYGNLRKVLASGVLRYSLISAHKDQIAGHFTLLRNSWVFKRLFMLIPHWRRILSKQDYRKIDEGHFSALFLTRTKNLTPKKIARSLAFSLLRRRALFFEAYSTILSSRPWHDGGSEYPLAWYWNRGRLTNSSDGEREFMYLHFMNLKSARYLPKSQGSKAAWEGLGSIVHVDPSAISTAWVIDENGFHG